MDHYYEITGPIENITASCNFTGCNFQTTLQPDPESSSILEFFNLIVETLTNHSLEIHPEQFDFDEYEYLSIETNEDLPEF